MRPTVRTIALIMALSSQTATAQVPVVNPSLEALSATNFAKEIAELARQLEEAKRLYDSINGATNQHDIVESLNDPKVRELLDQNTINTLSTLAVDINSLGNLSDKAKEVFNSTQVSVEDISAEDFYRQEIDRIKNKTARDVAVGDRIVKLSDERLSGLEKLRLALGNATTQKEVDALQARLQVETAILQNDTNRIQGLAMLQEAQLRVEEQREVERFKAENQKSHETIQKYFGDN